MEKLLIVLTDGTKDVPIDVTIEYDEKLAYTLTPLTDGMTPEQMAQSVGLDMIRIGNEIMKIKESDADAPAELCYICFSDDTCMQALVTVGLVMSTESFDEETNNEAKGKIFLLAPVYQNGVYSRCRKIPLWK